MIKERQKKESIATNNIPRTKRDSIYLSIYFFLFCFLSPISISISIYISSSFNYTPPISTSMIAEKHNHSSRMPLSYPSKEVSYTSISLTQLLALGFVIDVQMIECGYRHTLIAIQHRLGKACLMLIESMSATTGWMRPSLTGWRDAKVEQRAAWSC